MVTVQDALLTEGLKGSRVVAGERGLKREVRTVIIGEIPDIRDWLRGGDFVATTGYLMGLHPDGAETWAAGLEAKGAAALAIKPGRFIASIPELIKDLGNRRGFPIIELPPYAGQSEITEGILRLIVNEQAALLRHAEEVQNCLVQLVLKGAGLDCIAESVADLIGNPVLIESPYSELLGCSSSWRRSRLLMEARESPQFKELLKSYLKAEQVGESEIPKVASLLLGVDGRECRWVTMPVAAGSELHGFLSVVESGKRLDRRDYAVLEKASIVIALELCRERTYLVSQGSARAEFLHWFLENTDAGENTLRRRAAVLGFSLDQPCCAIFVKYGEALSPAPAAGCVFTPEPLRAARIAEDLVKGADKGAFILGRCDGLVVFYHPRSCSPGSVREEVRQLTSQLLNSLRIALGRCKLTAGIGRLYPDVSNLRCSFEEAQEAVKAVEEFGLTEDVISFDELGYYRVLSVMLRDRRQAASFCHDTLGKLLEDRSYHKELLSTLRTYLASDGNQAETARRMFLHIHSVQYRLKRIEELVGVALSSSATRLNLWLALKIWDAMKASTDIAQ